MTENARRKSRLDDLLNQLRIQAFTCIVPMENVKNLVSKNHYENFKKHIYFLRGLGYTSYWRILNGADFGCPQNRERVYFKS